MISRCLAFRALAGIIRHNSTVAAAELPEKWNLVSSVCLQRMPIITKDFTELEKIMLDCLTEQEYEKSLKSDWELLEEEEKIQLEETKAGKSDKIVSNRLEDKVQKWKLELASINLPPKVTEADKKNDTKSIDRVLDGTLLCAVQQKDCGNRWILPQRQRRDGETMRETAQRVVEEHYGPNVKCRFYGNAPCGFFKYKYPKAVREEAGAVGDKVFFFKAQYLSGGINAGGDVQDYKWLTRNELKKALEAKYFNSLDLFLFNES